MEQQGVFLSLAIQCTKAKAENLYFIRQVQNNVSVDNLRLNSSPTIKNEEIILIANGS